MKKNIRFLLFLIDTSGSMYGQNISAVNVAISECFDQLALLYDESINYMASFVSFNERIELIKFMENLSNNEPPFFSVLAKEDGFYPITKFSCMCDGLNEVLMNNMVYHNENIQKFIFLISDGKPIDSSEYRVKFKSIMSSGLLKDTYRYYVLMRENFDTFEKDILKFVEYNPKHIININDLTGEISKIQYTCFDDYPLDK